MHATYTDTMISTSLLLAKTKVAPICGCTIPRKELNGAQLLSRLLIAAANAFSIPLADIYAWSDFTIVLSWLSTSTAKLKTYLQPSDGHSWSHSIVALEACTYWL